MENPRRTSQWLKVDSCGLYWVPFRFSSFHPLLGTVGTAAWQNKEKPPSLTTEVWLSFMMSEILINEFFFTYSDNECSLNSPSILTLKKMFMGRVWWKSEVFWHGWRIMMYCSKCRLDRKYMSFSRNTQRMMLTSARTQGLPGVLRLCAIQIFQTCATGDDGCGWCRAQCCSSNRADRSLK